MDNRNQVKKSSKYDTVGTFLVITVYYKNHLVDYRTGLPLYEKDERGVIKKDQYGNAIPKMSFPYSIKHTVDNFYPVYDGKKSEKEYNFERYEYELKGLERIILGQFEGGNIVSNILIYVNSNKGKTLIGVNNLGLASISFQGKMVKKYLVGEWCPANVSARMTQFIEELKGKIR